MNWFTDTSKALLRGMGDLSPSCRHATRLQSEALDHPLTRSQRFGLRFHLLLCKWCRRYGKQLQFLRKASRNQPDQPALKHAGLTPEARERIRKKLADTQPQG